MPINRKLSAKQNNGATLNQENIIARKRKYSQGTLARLLAYQVN
jgi:hypothetical protein